MYRNQTIFTALTLCLVAVAPQRCQAEITFLGPTPYLSKADSPFPVDDSNPNFFLEDFEDGDFNTPGIVLPLDPYAQGAIRSKGQPFANSVDADDGTIDGSGGDGSAWASTIYANDLVDPPTISSYLSLSFDVNQSGLGPTSFGFVWTFGRSESVVRIDVYDVHANHIGFESFVGIGSGIDDDTRDDRFFGVKSSDEIGRVLLTSSYVGEPWFFEIDHVQIGFQIPEPVTTRMLVIALFAIPRRAVVVPRLIAMRRNSLTYHKEYCHETNAKTNRTAGFV